MIKATPEPREDSRGLDRPAGICVRVSPSSLKRVGLPAVTPCSSEEEQRFHTAKVRGSIPRRATM